MAVQLTRATDSWTPLNLTTLPEKPPIQPDLGGTGLVYPGKRHVFSGQPESAKTLAAYCVLIQVVRHGDTGILIDFEMGAYDARQRLRELGATEDEISRILYVEPDIPATPERIAALVEYEPQLVVIDAAAGAYQLEGLDDNKRLEVERFSKLYVGIFWRNDIATILIDHVVKNAEDRGRFQIGSERKLGGADVHYGFDIVQPISRGTTGRYKIHTHKDRAGYMKRGHLADLKLESDPDTHVITWTFTEPQPTTAEDGYFRPTHLMEKVSIDLELRHEAATRNQICEAIGGTKDYVLKAINALIIEGYASEQDGPNRKKLVHSTGRYREDDPACNASDKPGGSVVLFSSAGGSEPPKASSEQALRDTDDPGGSVLGSTIRQFGGSEWFDGGSRTTKRGGSESPVLRTGDETSAPDHQNHLGWFGDNGHLDDAPDLNYLASIQPEELD